MESKYYLVFQDGGTSAVARENLVSEIKEWRKQGIGVKVIFGVMGTFSKDGTLFRCGPDEFSLEDNETKWSYTSKEWKSDDDKS